MALRSGRSATVSPISRVVSRPQQLQRRVCTAAAGQKDAFPSGPYPIPPGPVGHFYRETEKWPTSETVRLQPHDLNEVDYVDLVVAGAGPAGVAVASRVAAAGFSVCVVDPEPLAHWPNNYGVWLDEFQVRRARQGAVWLLNTRRVPAGMSIAVGPKTRPPLRRAHSYAARINILLCHVKLKLPLPLQPPVRCHLARRWGWRTACTSSGPRPRSGSTARPTARSERLCVGWSGVRGGQGWGLRVSTARVPGASACEAGWGGGEACGVVGRELRGIQGCRGGSAWQSAGRA